MTQSDTAVGRNLGLSAVVQGDFNRESLSGIARWAIDGTSQEGNIYIIKCGDGRLMNLLDILGIHDGRGCWLVSDPGARFDPGAGTTGRRFKEAVNQSRNEYRTLLTVNFAHGSNATSGKLGCLAHGYDNAKAKQCARDNVATQKSGYGKSRGIGQDKAPFFEAVAVYLNTDKDGMVFLSSSSHRELCIESMLRAFEGITTDNILDPLSALGARFKKKLRKSLNALYPTMRPNIRAQLLALGITNAIHILQVTCRDRDECDLYNSADTVIVGYAPNQRRNKGLAIDDADQFALAEKFLMAVDHIDKNCEQGRTKRRRVKIVRVYDRSPNADMTREDKWQQIKTAEWLANNLGQILSEKRPEFLKRAVFQMAVVERASKKPEPLHRQEEDFKKRFQAE